MVKQGIVDTMTTTSTRKHRSFAASLWESLAHRSIRGDHKNPARLQYEIQAMSMQSPRVF